MAYYPDDSAELRTPLAARLDALARALIVRYRLALSHDAIVTAFIVAVATAFAAYWSLILTEQTNGVAALWFANGILLSALLTTPSAERRMIVLVIGTAANVCASVLAGRPLFAAIGFAIANTIEVGSAAYLLTRLSGGKTDFSNIGYLTSFTLIAGVACPAISGVLGATIAHLTFDAGFAGSFATWFRADALGLLIVTPALVLLEEIQIRHMTLAKKAEVSSLFAVLMVTALLIFADRFMAPIFLIAPILLIISCRLGPAVAAAATFLLSLVVFIAIGAGLSPALLGSDMSPAAQIDFIQLLIVTSFLTALPVAGVINGQERLRRQLAGEVAARDKLTAHLKMRKDQFKKQSAALEIERNRFRDAIDFLPEGLVMLDAQNRYIAWNKKYSEIYSATADLMAVGGSLEEVTRAGLKQGFYPDAIGREAEWLEDRLAKIKHPGDPLEQRLSDGRSILIQERRTTEGGLVSLRIDISEMKRREASTRLLFENNPVPMLVVADENSAILAVNDAAVRRYGYSKRDFARMSLREIQRERLPAPQDRSIWDGEPATAHTVKHVRRSGEVIDVEVYCNSIEHEGLPSTLIAAIDVTQRKQAENQAAHMARHDPLTNLPNRHLLSERMQQALARARRGDSIALLFLDLDDFKSINDTFGHTAGDALLQIVATRLCGCVRETDTIARLGGDEFAILLVGATLPGGAARVAQRILDCVRQPVELGNKEVTCEVSIGIAIAPDDACETGELFRYADLALYAAKAEKRGTYRFFQIGMDEKVRARNALEAELRTAVEMGQLQVHYQPIISAYSNKTSCVEALVRWMHPARGMIAPDVFIPIAEETGMIIAIGEYVLRKACKDAAGWPDDVAVSVNVSALELDNPKLIPTIRQALEDAQLPALRLQIEITETTLMKDAEANIKALEEIGAIGVEIAMDDFGTGYSSLSSLRSFPFDKIKIDRAFVKDLETTPEACAVLATIVALAGTLGMKTTAEGVETIEQHNIVKSYGCSELQGYLYCRPLSAQDLLLWFEREVQNAAAA